MAFIDIYDKNQSDYSTLTHMKNFITKITEKVGIDKITHFFTRATIALSVTLILCFIGSISNVIPYSSIGTNVLVIYNIIK